MKNSGFNSEGSEDSALRIFRRQNLQPKDSVFVLEDLRSSFRRIVQESEAAPGSPWDQELAELRDQLMSSRRREAEFRRLGVVLESKIDAFQIERSDLYKRLQKLHAAFAKENRNFQRLERTLDEVLLEKKEATTSFASKYRALESRKVQCDEEIRSLSGACSALQAEVDKYRHLLEKKTTGN